MKQVHPQLSRNFFALAKFRVVGVLVPKTLDGISSTSLPFLPLSNKDVF